jgi:hemerythrin-like domain-containing protein
MPQPPQLLNDDGSASIATTIMMSHHGFRRDIARFEVALRALGDDADKCAALREEWRTYHDHLHGHHMAEDNGVFPSMQSQAPQLEPTILRLSADHRRIEPLLERGDRAFAGLPQSRADALAVVSELATLLEPHLSLEEAEVLPLLRAAKQFPPPASDDELDLYAEGFAWASHGIAEDVLQQVYALLPQSLANKLPAARVAFEARCVRVWGTAKAGAARTPIPDAV